MKIFMNIVEENMFKGDKISLFLIDFFGKFSKNCSNDFNFFAFIIKMLLEIIANNPFQEIKAYYLKIINLIIIILAISLWDFFNFMFFQKAFV